MKTMTLQEIILKLERYWADYGCIIFQPYDIEKGAGTFNPATFLKVLGAKPWQVGYVEPSRRPTDGRYGENPNRLQHYYQYQVIIKPAPKDSQKIYLDSLGVLGIDLNKHDVRFIEDDWESPTLGASGLGWEVRLDGLEISQFTYFQRMGTVDLNPVSLEITYGLERIGLFIQKKESIFDLEWVEGISYGDIHFKDEVQYSRYNFELVDPTVHTGLFDTYEREAQRLIKEGLYLPAYDYVLKCSHTFNLLDARRAVSTAQRTAYITRVRALARNCAMAYLKDEEPRSNTDQEKVLTKK